MKMQNISSKKIKKKSGTNECVTKYSILKHIKENRMVLFQKHAIRERFNVYMYKKTLTNRYKPTLCDYMLSNALAKYIRT